MPYSISNPPERIKALPKHAQEIFIAAFNAAIEQYDGDEGRANATAYAAVKQKYEQDAEGNWREKKALDVDSVTTTPPIEWTGEFDGDETKAGRRMSGAQLEKAKGALQAFADLIKWASYEDAEPEDAEDDAEDAAEMAKALVTVGSEVKALGSGIIGGYLVRFGDANTTDLSSMADYFTPDTDFDLDDDGLGKSTVLYHHGQDPLLKARKLGRAALRVDDVGVWMEGQLKLRDDYERAVYSMVEAGKMGLSSGTAPHLVERETQANGSHKITRWPLGLDASITPIPAEPRTSVVALKTYLDMAEPYVKALLPQAGAIPQAPAEDATKAEPTPEPTTSTPDVSRETSNGEYEMDDTQLQTLIAQTVESTTKAIMDKLAAEPAINPAGVATKAVDTGVNPTVKAFYASQFGEPRDEIKAVLTDLHGKDYEAKFWQQKQAFRRYLRGGERALKAGDEGLLRQVIFTPQYVTKALSDGMDLDAMKTTMVEASDTLGGYLVPVDFQARIIERLPGMTIVRPRANVMTTSRDVVELPKGTGGDSQYTNAVRITWVDEEPSSTAAATNATFGQERIPVHTAMGTVALSRNLLEDAAVPLEGWLATQFAQAAAIDEDNLFLTGDGNGKPQGIIPSGTNALSLSTDNSGHASTLTWDGLIALTYTVDAQYRQNAVFVMEKATAEIIAKLKDGDGQYLWRQNYGDNATVGGAGRVRTLLGYPVLEQEAMPSVSASTYPIIFGDLSGYTVVDRIGMSVERYLDSSTAVTNTVKFVMRRRLGGQVLEPWKFTLQYVSA